MSMKATSVRLDIADAPANAQLMTIISTDDSRPIREFKLSIGARSILSIDQS